MKTETPQTIYLKDYTKPAYWIDAVDLNFVSTSDGTTVTNTASIRRNPDLAAQPLVLDGEDLETLLVTVDGKNVPFSVTPSTLTMEPDGVLSSAALSCRG